MPAAGVSCARGFGESFVATRILGTVVMGVGGESVTRWRLRAASSTASASGRLCFPNGTVKTCRGGVEGAAGMDAFQNGTGGMGRVCCEEMRDTEAQKHVL